MLFGRVRPQQVLGLVPRVVLLHLRRGGFGFLQQDHVVVGLLEQGMHILPGGDVGSEDGEGSAPPSSALRPSSGVVPVVGDAVVMDVR